MHCELIAKMDQFKKFIQIGLIRSFSLLQNLNCQNKTEAINLKFRQKNIVIKMKQR